MDEEKSLVFRARSGLRASAHVHLYLWFCTSSELAWLVLFAYVGFLGCVGGADLGIIRLGSSPSSARCWALHSVLAVVLVVMSGFVFGGLSLLRGGLVLGARRLVVCGLLVDRLPLFMG